MKLYRAVAIGMIFWISAALAMDQKTGWPCVEPVTPSSEIGTPHSEKSTPNGGWVLADNEVPSLLLPSQVQHSSSSSSLSRRNSLNEAVQANSSSSSTDIHTATSTLPVAANTSASTSGFTIFGWSLWGSSEQSSVPNASLAQVEQVFDAKPSPLMGKISEEEPTATSVYSSFDQKFAREDLSQYWKDLLREQLLLTYKEQLLLTCDESDAQAAQALLWVSTLDAGSAGGSVLLNGCCDNYQSEEELWPSLPVDEYRLVEMPTRFSSNQWVQVAKKPCVLEFGIRTKKEQRDACASALSDKEPKTSRLVSSSDVLEDKTEQVEESNETEGPIIESCGQALVIAALQKSTAHYSIKRKAKRWQKVTRPRRSKNKQASANVATSPEPSLLKKLAVECDDMSEFALRHKEVRDIDYDRQANAHEKSRKTKLRFIDEAVQHQRRAAHRQSQSSNVIYKGPSVKAFLARQKQNTTRNNQQKLVHSDDWQTYE